MVANRKVTGTATSMPTGFAAGTLVSLLVTFVGAILCGYLINREVLPESGIGYSAMALILLSAVLGTSVAVSKIKRRRVYVCAISGLIYFGILLSMTALFFGGQYQGIGVTLLLVIGGSTLVALLGLRGEKAPKYHKHIFTNR